MRDSKKKSLTLNRGTWVEQAYKYVRVPKSGQAVNAGGRPSLPDNYLMGAFWSLVDIFEKGWPLVGLELERIRATRKRVALDSVRNALEPLRTWGEGFLYRLLLSPEPLPVTAKELSQLRRKFGQAVEERLKADDAARSQTDIRNESANALQIANDALINALNSFLDLARCVVLFQCSEQLLVWFFFCQQLVAAVAKIRAIAEQVHKERVEELERLESVQAAARKKQNALEQELNRKKAFFVQTQALDFLRDHRYKLTPRSFASALAGLTDMQWRQSVLRCKKIGCDMAVHTRYQVLEAMFYILRNHGPHTAEEAVEFFRDAIQHLPHKYNHAGSYLSDHWSELRCVVERCWDKGTRPRAVAYKITSSFLDELGRPTNALDRVLRTTERL